MKSPKRTHHSRVTAATASVDQGRTSTPSQSL